MWTSSGIVTLPITVCLGILCSVILFAVTNAVCHLSLHKIMGLVLERTVSFSL